MHAAFGSNCSYTLIIQLRTLNITRSSVRKRVMYSPVFFTSIRKTAKNSFLVCDEYTLPAGLNEQKCRESILISGKVKPIRIGMHRYVLIISVFQQISIPVRLVSFFHLRKLGHLGPPKNSKTKSYRRFRRPWGSCAYPFCREGQQYVHRKKWTKPFQPTPSQPARRCPKAPPPSIHKNKSNSSKVQVDKFSDEVLKANNYTHSWHWPEPTPFTF